MGIGGFGRMLSVMAVDGTTQPVDLATVERGRLRPLVGADMAVTDQLHADDFQLVTPSGRTLTKAAYLDPMAAGEVRYLIWATRDIAIRTHGDSPVLRYPALLQIAMDGTRKPPFRCWHLDLYERREGRRQVGWSQATRVDG